MRRKKNPLVNETGEVIGTVTLHRSPSKNIARSNLHKKVQNGCITAAWLLFVVCICWGIMGMPYLRWDEPLHPGKDGEPLLQENRAFTNYISFGKSRRVYAGEFGEGLPWLIFIPLGEDGEKPEDHGAGAEFVSAPLSTQQTKETIDVSATNVSGPEVFSGLGASVILGIECPLPRSQFRTVKCEVMNKDGRTLLPRSNRLTGSTLRSGTAEVQRIVESYPGAAATMRVTVPPLRTRSYIALRHHLPHESRHEETDRSWWWDHMVFTTKRQIPVEPSLNAQTFTFSVDTLESIDAGGAQ